MATLGGHQYSGGFSAGPLGQAGFGGGGAGGFGAMGSPSAANYKPPRPAVQPRPAAAANPLAQMMMARFMPGQQLNVGGMGLPAYGAQVPGYQFFGPSFGGAIPGMAPGGLAPGLLQNPMRPGHTTGFR